MAKRDLTDEEYAWQIGFFSGKWVDRFALAVVIFSFACALLVVLIMDVLEMPII